MIGSSAILTPTRPNELRRSKSTQSSASIWSSPRLVMIPPVVDTATFRAPLVTTRRDIDHRLVRVDDHNVIGHYVGDPDLVGARRAASVDACYTSNRFAGLGHLAISTRQP